MERRTFLKGSAAAVGALAAGRELDAVTAGPAEASESAPAALAPANMVEVPATSYQATDPVTGVPTTVTIGNFLIAPFEVTQREFEAITGSNPSFHKGPDLPVETVSWWEAIRYCNFRSVKEGLEACYELETGACDIRKNGYRLPTEAEWVHAAGPFPVLPHVHTNECGSIVPGAPGPSPALLSRAADHIANLGGLNTKSVDLLLHDLKVYGTTPVGSYPPNQYELCDMYGNVWEWCNDFADPVPAPERSYNPTGPERGLERVVRGGSFVSNSSLWSSRESHTEEGHKGVSSFKAALGRPGQGNAWCCMDAGYKSRFTGFRVCRSITPIAPPPLPARGIEWLKEYNQAPQGYETSTGNLLSLISGVTSIPEWEHRREHLRAKWLKLLGDMEISPPLPKVRLIERVKDENYAGRIMQLQTEPDMWLKIMVTMPAEPLARPCPVIIVPFYDVDDPAGRDLSGCAFFGGGVAAFARMAVQRGYIAAAVRWWEAEYGEADTEAVANLKLRHPHCTGLGKWVWDTHRVVDYLYTLPEVDRRHIGIIGHSMGGKMALYAGAFDERITAVVASEPGIGLTFSNYDDYWYFGKFILKMIEEGTDQQELLGLIAPRPFLLIGGHTCDTEKSWYYINAAREVYQLYGKPLDIGYITHRKQHNPTPEADWRAMEWLTHFLGPEISEVNA
ncbi:MAG: SUMF1/EgtB/PvdO family nonheme iron enzyme [Terriglobia bacterium]